VARPIGANGAVNQSSSANECTSCCASSRTQLVVPRRTISSGQR
jgi:hypothetical protein